MTSTNSLGYIVPNASFGDVQCGTVCGGKVNWVLCGDTGQMGAVASGTVLSVAAAPIAGTSFAASDPLLYLPSGAKIHRIDVTATGAALAGASITINLASAPATALVSIASATLNSTTTTAIVPSTVVGVKDTLQVKTGTGTNTNATTRLIITVFCSL